MGMRLLLGWGVGFDGNLVVVGKGKGEGEGLIPLNIGMGYIY